MGSQGQSWGRHCEKEKEEVLRGPRRDGGLPNSPREALGGNVDLGCVSIGALMIVTDTGGTWIGLGITGAISRKAGPLFKESLSFPVWKVLGSRGKHQCNARILPAPE